MGLFARRRAAAPIVARSSPISWGDYVAAASTAGPVSEASAGTIDGAMRSSVVYRCSTLVAGTISTFPVHAKSGRLTVDPAPPIVARPSPLTRRSVWIESAVMSLMLRGGAYGLVDDVSMGRTGWPSAVDLIHPDRVDWTTKDGWTLDGKAVEEYPLGPLWQVPLHVLAGSPKGLSPLSYARRTIFAGLAAQEFGANFFHDGGHPTAVVKMPPGAADPDETDARRFKSKIMQVTNGTSREPLILPAGTDWQQISINPDDSQFIESMRFSAEDLCRFFGIDPSMAGLGVVGTSLTYSNISDRRDDLKQFTLLLPMMRLEEAWSELAPGDVAVKLSPAGLLRASLKDRYESYKTAAEINKLTGEEFLAVDEMRDLEDREPVPPIASGEPQWQKVGLPALVDGQILTPNEAREELGRPGMAGGDKWREPIQGATP